MRYLPLKLAGILGVAALSTAGCDGGSGSTGGGGEGGSQMNPSNPFDAASRLCVDTINDYRKTLDLPPYARWVDQEVCTNDEAQSDGMSDQPHGAFGTCGEWAQDECPGWPGPPEQMITDCLAQMWAEGPGGGHYENMASKDYTMAACGYWITPGGDVWATQNFK